MKWVIFGGLWKGESFTFVVDLGVLWRIIGIKNVSKQKRNDTWKCWSAIFLSSQFSRLRSSTKTPWGLQGFFRGGVALGVDLFPLCPGLEIRPDAPGSAYEWSCEKQRWCCTIDSYVLWHVWLAVLKSCWYAWSTPWKRWDLLKRCWALKRKGFFQLFCKSFQVFFIDILSRVNAGVGLRMVDIITWKKPPACSRHFQSWVCWKCGVLYRCHFEPWQSETLQ